MPKKTYIKKSPADLGEPRVYKNDQRNSWICDYWVLNEGALKARRVRRSFATEKHAEVHKAEVKNARKVKARNSLLEAANLSREKTIFLLGLNKLIEDTQLPPDALEKALRSLVAVDAEPLAMAQAAEVYKNAKKGNWSPITFASERTRIHRFVRECGVEHVHELTPRLIIRILAATPKAQRRHMAKTIASFTKFFSDPFHSENYRLRDPMPHVKAHFRNQSDASVKESPNAHQPTCLSLREVRLALRNAIGITINGVHRPEFLGCVVLGIFLGLRPFEAWRLSLASDPWERHIKLSRTELDVDYSIVGKKGERRYPQIRPNVRLWLEFIRDYGFALGYNRDSQKARARYALFRRSFLGQKASQPEWNDVFRHTFGTYLYHSIDLDDPKRQVSQDYIVRQMGNSVRIYLNHFRGNLLDADTAEEFWSIVPSDFGTFTEAGFRLHK